MEFFTTTQHLHIINNDEMLFIPKGTHFTSEGESFYFEWNGEIKMGDQKAPPEVVKRYSGIFMRQNIPDRFLLMLRTLDHKFGVTEILVKEREDSRSGNRSFVYGVYKLITNEDGVLELVVDATEENRFFPDYKNEKKLRFINWDICSRISECSSSEMDEYYGKEKEGDE